MIVVGIFQLIFNYDISPRSFFLCKNIHAEVADIRFFLFKRYIDADSFTKKSKIFLLSKSRRKISAFILPDLSEICYLNQFIKFHFLFTTKLISIATYSFLPER